MRLLRSSFLIVSLWSTAVACPLNALFSEEVNKPLILPQVMDTALMQVLTLFRGSSLKAGKRGRKLHFSLFTQCTLEDHMGFYTDTLCGYIKEELLG